MRTTVLLALGIGAAVALGVWMLVSKGRGASDYDPAAEFLAVPPAVCKEIVLSVKELSPGVSNCYEAVRALVEMLLAASLYPSGTITSTRIVTGLVVDYWDYGGANKYLSIQAKPGDSERERAIITVADPTCITDLENQEIWQREGNITVVVGKRDSAADTARIRVIRYGRERGSNTYVGMMYYRGVAVLLEPRRPLAASDIGELVAILETIALKVQMYYDRFDRIVRALVAMTR